MFRTIASAATTLFVLLFAARAYGQVQIGVSFEKDRYLAGEPVVVVVDVINVGDNATLSVRRAA